MGQTQIRNLAEKANTATLDDLIRELTDLRARRPDLGSEPVLLAYEYGDYCRTTALAVVHSPVFSEVRETAYSSSGLAVESACDGEQTIRKVTNHAIVLGLGRMNDEAHDLENTVHEVVL